eukprot:4437214-Prymnesium_polylepis.1
MGEREGEALIARRWQQRWSAGRGVRRRTHCSEVAGRGVRRRTHCSEVPADVERGVLRGGG